MTKNESHMKKYVTLAWILLLVGIVFGVDGLLQLIAGNSDRMGEASLGGILAMLSSVFFGVSHFKQPKPEIQAAK